jgi:hypothetical protein
MFLNKTYEKGIEQDNYKYVNYTEKEKGNKTFRRIKWRRSKRRARRRKNREGRKTRIKNIDVSEISV